MFHRRYAVLEGYPDTSEILTNMFSELLLLASSSMETLQTMSDHIERICRPKNALK